jgi:hypothetical protein
MGTDVSPHRVHGYRFQSIERSWAQISVHKGFMGTGVSPQRFHGYKCQFAEGLWVQVSSTESVHGYRYYSKEGSLVQVSVHRDFMSTAVSLNKTQGYRC